MKVFLTGGTGFVGSRFLRDALDRGHQVMALRRSNSRIPSIEHSLLHWVEGDLRTVPWKSLESWQPEVLVHSAWIATPGVYLHSPLNQELCDASCAVIERALALGVRRILVTGTCAEYAPSVMPIPEVGEVGPSSPYAVAKNQLRCWLESNVNKLGGTWCWCRLFYPYGLGEQPGRLPSYVIRAIRSGAIVQLQQPYSVRDYIHIQDVSEGLLTAMNVGFEGILNLGSGVGVTVLDLASMIARTMGHAELVPDPGQRSGVDSSVVADVSRLIGLGWRRGVSLEQGVHELVNATQ